MKFVGIYYRDIILLALYIINQYDDLCRRIHMFQQYFVRTIVLLQLAIVNPTEDVHSATVHIMVDIVNTVSTLNHECNLGLMMLSYTNNIIIKK